MSIKCKLGIHEWDECVCTKCGTIRSTHHNFAEDCEKCSKCGTRHTGYHEWGKNCEKCSKCGITREHAHTWKDNCEKCSTCGEERRDRHNTVNGVCTICGHGIFIDDDQKQYQIIRIGGNILMAENYAKTPSSGEYWIYDDETANLTRYGYLYDFETAVNMAPKGWHLPSKSEWESVLNAAGGNSHGSYENLRIGGHSGFNAVFGGWRSKFHHFIGKNATAHYWTATRESEDKAWQFMISAHDHKMVFNKSETALGLSVRYFKD